MQSDARTVNCFHPSPVAGTRAKASFSLALQTVTLSNRLPHPRLEPPFALHHHLCNAAKGKPEHLTDLLETLPCALSLGPRKAPVAGPASSPAVCLSFPTGPNSGMSSTASCARFPSVGQMRSHPAFSTCKSSFLMTKKLKLSTGDTGMLTGHLKYCLSICDLEGHSSLEKILPSS